MSTIERVEEILLDQINVNPKWNTRSSLAEYSDGPDGKNGLDGLIASIKARGQDDPVYVRPAAKEGSKKPFDLVAGFRRFEAMRRIAHEAGNKTATIKAIVRKLSDAEAVSLNVRENCAREDLSGADLVFGVKRMVDMLEAESKGKKITQTDVANELGFSQGYMGKIMHIGGYLRLEILEKWRGESVKLTVDQILAVSKEPHDKQMAAYNELVRGKAEKEGEDGKGRNSIDPHKRAAARFATQIGILVREGHLDEVDPDSWFDEVLPLMVKLKKGKEDLNKRDVAKVVKAAKEAYATAVAGEDETEETEEKPAKGRSKDAHAPS